MPEIVVPKHLKKKGSDHDVATFIERQKAVLNDPSQYRAEIRVTVRDVESDAVIAEYALEDAIQYGVWGFTQKGSDEGNQGFGFDFLSTRENGFQAQRIIEERWLYGPAKRVVTSMAMRDQMRKAGREGGKSVEVASAFDLPPEGRR